MISLSFFLSSFSPFIDDMGYMVTHTKRIEKDRESCPHRKNGGKLRSMDLWVQREKCVRLLNSRFVNSKEEEEKDVWWRNFFSPMTTPPNAAAYPYFSQGKYWEWLCKQLYCFFSAAAAMAWKRKLGIMNYFSKKRTWPGTRIFLDQPVFVVWVTIKGGTATQCNIKTSQKMLLHKKQLFIIWAILLAQPNFFSW